MSDRAALQTKLMARPGAPASKGMGMPKSTGMTTIEVDTLILKSSLFGRLRALYEEFLQHITIMDTVSGPNPGCVEHSGKHYTWLLDLGAISTILGPWPMAWYAIT